MQGKVIQTGTIRHPASDILGEDQMMCAECGAIDGHTVKCAVVRFEKAKNVTRYEFTPGPCIHCSLPVGHHINDRFCPEWRLRQLDGDR